MSTASKRVDMATATTKYGWTFVPESHMAAVHPAAHMAYRHRCGIGLILIYRAIPQEPAYSWLLLLKINNQYREHVSSPEKPPLEWAATVLRQHLGSAYRE